MERIMNEENYWNHNVEWDAVIGPVECVCRDEVVQALNEMKSEIDPELFLFFIVVDFC